MMKKNVHAHVLLQPQAYRLDQNGFVVKPAVDDDWWLIQSVTDDGVTISDPRTGHFRLLGYDHIQKFTSDGIKNGARRGFVTLLVQLYVQGIDVRILPTRPGEPLPPSQPKVVEKRWRLTTQASPGFKHASWRRAMKLVGLVPRRYRRGLRLKDTRSFWSQTHKECSHDSEPTMA